MNTQRVLITGGSGMLGRYLMHTIPIGFEAAATRFANNAAQTAMTVNIVNFEDVQRLFYVYKPHIVIHTAAIGAVDYCEKHPELARAVNIQGTSNIAINCVENKAKMVLISTNAVFNGENPPYTENDEPCPISVYGDTKVLAEECVQTLLQNSLIIRTSRLFGTHWTYGRENWIDIAYKNLRAKKLMKIVTDDTANPTYARGLAQAIWYLLTGERSGIFNVAGTPSMSMYDFVSMIARVFEYDTKLVQPITSDQLPEGVMKRPANTTYDLKKLKDTGFAMDLLDVERGLFETRGELYD